MEGVFYLFSENLFHLNIQSSSLQRLGKGGKEISPPFASFQKNGPTPSQLKISNWIKQSGCPWAREQDPQSSLQTKPACDHSWRYPPVSMAYPIHHDCCWVLVDNESSKMIMIQNCWVLTSHPFKSQSYAHVLGGVNMAHCLPSTSQWSLPKMFQWEVWECIYWREDAHAFADISSQPFLSKEAGRHCEFTVCPGRSNKARVRCHMFSFHLHKKTSYRSILMPDSAFSHHRKPHIKGTKCRLGDII